MRTYRQGDQTLADDQQGSQFPDLQDAWNRVLDQNVETPRTDELSPPRFMTRPTSYTKPKSS